MNYGRTEAVRQNKGKKHKAVVWPFSSHYKRLSIQMFWKWNLGYFFFFCEPYLIKIVVQRPILVIFPWGNYVKTLKPRRFLNCKIQIVLFYNLFLTMRLTIALGFLSLTTVCYLYTKQMNIHLKKRNSSEDKLIWRKGNACCFKFEVFKKDT